MKRQDLQSAFIAMPAVAPCRRSAAFAGRFKPDRSSGDSLAVCQSLARLGPNPGKGHHQFPEPGETRTKSFCPEPGGRRFCGMLKDELVAGQLAAFQVPAVVHDWRLVEASI